MKFLVLFTALSFFVGFACADELQLSQYADIAELMMKKYQINVDNTDFTIFYRFSTVGQGEGSDEDTITTIKSIELDKERKSLIISIDNLNQTDILSIQFPKKLVSAEGTKLTLLVDGKEKGYESNVQGIKRTMIFVLPANSEKIEIVGTRVIPEFPSGLLALPVIISGMIIMQRLGKF